MKLTPPHGPLHHPRNCNYAVLRELIEETHHWRQKKNRGTLQLFSHTSCYFMDMDESENIRFGLGWYAFHEEPDPDKPVTNGTHWVRDTEKTEHILWTLDANNVYTLQLPTEDFRRGFTYIFAMHRASPFAVANHTIHGVHQVKVWVRNQRTPYRYEQGLRVTRAGDVLGGGVPFTAPRLDKAAAQSYRFLGQWFKDAKAMAQFDTRTRDEHGEAVAGNLRMRHWGLMDVAERIVKDPADSFELFYLTLMSRRWLGSFYRKPDATVTINDQLISAYRSLRERILQQAGVYTLPYKV